MLEGRQAGHDVRAINKRPIETLAGPCRWPIAPTGGQSHFARGRTSVQTNVTVIVLLWPWTSSQPQLVCDPRHPVDHELDVLVQLDAQVGGATHDVVPAALQACTVDGQLISRWHHM
ncbi:MAG: hypothetical protein K8T91_06035 [Planctomycetes bacterium]|nr:hypothetical protein [Planctomycetota bacterium]